MKNVLRLMCGWMAIALAACTGDELQQIDPLQKPVAQKTISVKAYTPSEQAATRLDFKDKGEDGLKLSWTADDAFTAVIDGEEVTFTYNESSKEFTANVNESVTLTDGLKAYYPAYDGENFEMDFSRQTGQLNSATTYMEGVYEGDAFSFNHSTAILKAKFSGLPQNAAISSIQISGAVDITISNATISKDSIYINLPAIAKDGQLTFDVRTSDGTLYTATKTVAAEKDIQTGVYYNTTVALSPAPVCNLPTGGVFNAAVKSFLQSNSSLTKIKFIAKSPATTKSDANDENATEDYNYRLVAGSDNTLEIHTVAAEFVFNENCSGMFSYLTNIQSIDFGNCVNTSNVTNMANMFNDCYLLTSLDLSSFNTANVVHMSYMFYSCQGLTSLDLSSFNTANVTDMDYMFYNCSSLTSLDLSNFNTANVTSMANMFNICSSLTSLNVSSFNTANVENMSSMFSYCQKLASLDLSSFDFNGVENRGDEHFSQMFYCLGESAAHRPIPVYVTMAGYNVLSKKSMTGIDNSSAQLVALCELPTGNSFNSAVKSFLSENSSLTIIKFVAKSSNTNTSKPISSISGAYMVAGSDNTLEIHTSAAGFLFNKYCNHMFTGLSTITAINFNDCINTSNVTDMKYMFNNCSLLTSLDLSSFNTEKVTNMASMFRGCQKLTSLNVSNFNTANVTDMSSMFSYCKTLTSLDLSSFNTANVVNMDDMFDSCYALTSLDLSNFNTANVEQMSYMFNFCSELTSLDLSSFNTANVIFMNDMFNSCSSLTSLDLSNFNTAKVTNMSYMFNNCSALESLNVSSFNTANVTDMASMFSFCSNISELDLINFDFRNVDVGYGFDGMFTNLGEYSDNLPPVIIYVKDENDKIILESANTGIPDRVIISVKQP